MKHYRLLAVLVAVLGLLAAACGDDGGGGGDGGDTATPDTSDLPTEVGEGEGALNIIAWAGYVEDGSTEADIDWVTDFENETGCQVEATTAGTSDEMVSLMTNSSDYDLVTASGDASLRLIAGETVQPVNLDLIPSYSTVDERLQGAPWYTIDGVAYGVPYTWGADVLMYNTDVFSEAPTSWGTIYEEQDFPDGQSNSGRIQQYDGPISIATAALFVKATQPDLGIEDPYALNQEQYDAVIEVVRDSQPLVQRYWHDVVVQTEDFTTEGTAASSSWPYQVNLLVDEPVASVIPDEGTTGWADTTMLATNAPHPNCAYLWMEHSLDPTVQGDVAYWFGSVPAVPAACEGNALLTDEGCATNGFDTFDQVAFWKTPEADCFGDGGECVPYSQWTEDYLAIQGGN
jgi:putative spermidine/putrescine transport system substrate-binding protein